MLVEKESLDLLDPVVTREIKESQEMLEHLVKREVVVRLKLDPLETKVCSAVKSYNT